MDYRNRRGDTRKNVVPGGDPSGGRDALRRLIVPKAKSDTMAKETLDGKDTEELEDISRIADKYKDYNATRLLVQGTVHRTERLEQIDTDAESIRGHLRNIQESLREIIPTLPPADQEQLKKDLEALRDETKAIAADPQDRKNVLKGRRNPFLLHKKEDRNNAEHNYEAKRLTNS